MQWAPIAFTRSEPSPIANKIPTSVAPRPFKNSRLPDVCALLVGVVSIFAVPIASRSVRPAPKIARSTPTTIAMLAIDIPAAFEASACGTTIAAMLDARKKPVRTAVSQLIGFRLYCPKHPHGTLFWRSKLKMVIVKNTPNNMVAATAATALVIGINRKIATMISTIGSARPAKDAIALLSRPYCRIDLTDSLGLANFVKPAIARNVAKTAFRRVALRLFQKNNHPSVILSGTQ